MGTHCDLSTRITVNGVEFADENILEGRAKHFEELGTPETTGFNESFRDQVCLELAHMETASKAEEDTLLVSITKTEVEAAIKSLSLHKAAGPDQIQPEHLRYGGDLLVQHL